VLAAPTATAAKVAAIAILRVTFISDPSKKLARQDYSSRCLPELEAHRYGAG
jgi:hypothetical protein